MTQIDPLLDLTGRVAVVTGAGQGIGRQTVLNLAGHGAAVVVNDYYAERAEAVADEVAKAGGTALAVAGDVTSYTDVAALMQRAVTDLGRLDILVNNAGNLGAHPDPALATTPFWELAPGAWEPIVAVNFDGVLNCCHAALRHMMGSRGAGGEEHSGGRLLTVISDAGRVGEANLEAYSGAKAGAAGFMRGLARSVARFGITANCVAVAATRTPAIEAALSAGGERMEQAMLRQYPLGRLGEPADAAALLLFLASPAASWITGQTYPVNGGFSFNL